MTFDDFLEKQMHDAEFKKEYEALESEYNLIRQVINARLEKQMTQKELAERSGTKQSSIARLESGNYNPSFKFLQKIATAMGKQVIITFK